MTRPFQSPALAVALAAILATACASTGEASDQAVPAEASVPEGQLGMLVEDLLYGSPEERVRAAGDIASQGERGRAAAPFLIEALRNDQPLVRGEAARALSMIAADPEQAVPALVAALGEDDDEQVLAAVSEALSRFGPAAVDALVDSLETGTSSVQVLAAQSLGFIGHDASDAQRSLIFRLRDEDAAVRAASARALGRVALGTTEAVQPMVRLLDDGDESVRASAAWALGEFGERARWTTLSLVNSLKDQSPEVRRECARALGKMGSSASQAALDLKSAVDSDPDESVRREAAEALRQIRNEPALQGTN